MHMHKHRLYTHYRQIMLYVYIYCYIPSLFVLSSLFGNLRCQPALIEELPGTLTPKRPEIAETPGCWFMNQPKK